MQIVAWQKVTSFLPATSPPEARSTLYISEAHDIARWAYQEPEDPAGRALRKLIKRSGRCWEHGLGYPIANSDVLTELVGLAERAGWRVAGMTELTDLPNLSLDILRCGNDAYSLQVNIDDWRRSLAAHHGQRLRKAVLQLAYKTGYAWVHQPFAYETLISVPMRRVAIEEIFNSLASFTSISDRWGQLDSSRCRSVVFSGALSVTVELDFTDPLHLLFVKQKFRNTRKEVWINPTLQLPRRDWDILAEYFVAMGGRILENCLTQRSIMTVDLIPFSGLYQPSLDEYALLDQQKGTEMYSPSPDEDLPEVVPPDPRRPAPPAASDAKLPRLGAGLDQSRLATIRIETREVSTLLGEIFAEDEDAPARVAAEAPPPTTGGQDGLDPRHSALLATLSTREEWASVDFGRLVRETGLMPGAARDVLNGWSLDRHDEIVLEGDDPVVVNVHLAIGEV